MPWVGSAPARVVVLAAGCGLVACAAEPALRTTPESSYAAARRLLVERAAAGPVQVEIERPPAALGAAGPARQEIARLAAEGVRGLRPTLTPEPVPGPTLVLAFDTSPVVSGTAVCAGERPPLVPAPPGEVRLRAVFCDGGLPVAETLGVAEASPAAVERLIWRSTALLFPDDYPERYGFNLFGDRLRFGLGGSFGF
ncbi:MAG TPA: hypothetical protein VFG43_13440 [Geminicoccaceae bacterium]|nr:hypothetical protein [Geminicoccaceae bacterium]